MARDWDVEAVRAFSRHYTNVIGALRDELLDTPYSLGEARVIFELAQREETPLSELRDALDIDAGYLSRIIDGLEKGGLALRQRSASDGRRQVIRLGAKGRKAFATLDARSASQIRELLGRLEKHERAELTEAMATIRRLLGDPALASDVSIRPARSGDYGWVVERHGVLYDREYAWDETFEGLVARVVADFVETCDARRERAWVAELGGLRAGCIFCIRKDDDTAQLRLLLTEPWARGRGIGTRLVETCMRFAKRAGYARMVLWTNHPLVDARRVYERAGFALAREEPHTSFGHDLVGQYWEREL